MNDNLFHSLNKYYFYIMTPKLIKYCVSALLN